MDIIAVNQKMIKQWAQECEMDKYLAMFMVCLDSKEPDVMKGIRLFASEGMPIPAVIRNLRHLADMLEQSNFKRAENNS